MRAVAQMGMVGMAANSILQEGREPQAVAVVSPRATGRHCSGVGLLRDRHGHTLAALRDTLPTGDTAEATMMIVWRLLQEAERHHVSRLAVHLSDPRAARILSREEAVPTELAQWYFAARTASNKLGRVRFRSLSPRYVERLKAVVQRVCEDREARRLTLFGDAEADRNAA